MSEENLSNWEKSNISDHFELLIGGTPKRNNENYWDTAKETENRWVSIKDLKGRYLFETEERISELGIRESNVKLIPEGTVIMSFKLTIGRLSITKRPLYTNEAIVSFIPKRANSVDTNYLYYGLQSWSLLEEVDQAVKGATLNKDKMSRIVGLFPPLPEQRKIASILTSVDEVIENTQKQIEKLQDLKKAVMNDLLTRGIGHTEFKDSELGRIPKGWNLYVLEKVSSIVMGQSPNSNTYNDEGDGLPFFQGKADFGRRSPQVKYWCSIPIKVVPKNSILLSVRAPVGDINLSTEESCIGRGLASITAISVDREFLYQFLLYSKPRFEALGQGSTFEAINGAELRSFTIKVPSLPEQKKIASILTSMDENIEEKQRKLHKTESLKKSLMQDLLTGKVRVKVN